MTNNQKQFVIQKHSSREDTHWDLMLEKSGSLQTFRLDTPPDQLLTKPAQAVKIDDHDPKFLTYQGPVNKGAGKVEIADKGTYKIKKDDRHFIEMDMVGKILKGSFKITHTQKDNWLFAPAEN